VGYAQAGVGHDDGQTGIAHREAADRVVDGVVVKAAVQGVRVPVHLWRESGVGREQVGPHCRGFSGFVSQFLQQISVDVDGSNVAVGAVGRQIVVTRTDGLEHSTGAALSNWTPKEISRLGTDPVAELAAILGRSVESVHLKPQKLKIEAPLQPARAPEEIRLLGTKP